MSSDIERYFTDLQILAISDLTLTDRKLLTEFKNSLEAPGDLNVAIVDASPEIQIKLFIEDLKRVEGPFQLPCLTKWNGKRVKEEIHDLFGFPCDHQTLITESVSIKDDETLLEHGISKNGSALRVFLLRRKKTHTPSEALALDGSSLSQSTSSFSNFSESERTAATTLPAKNVKVTTSKIRALNPVSPEPESSS